VDCVTEADNGCSGIEYERHLDSYFDPFAVIFNDTYPVPAAA